MRLIPTDRKWGDKKPSSELKIKVEGISVVVKTKDFWEGPVLPDQEGSYSRGIWIE